ncbi:hypothetical protein KM043_010375 [Ampulex compressa]|nr:hypothetical protein KM043_010375 [Ampulex compressa]
MPATVVACVHSRSLQLGTSKTPGIRQEGRQEGRQEKEERPARREGGKGGAGERGQKGRKEREEGKKQRGRRSARSSSRWYWRWKECSRSREGEVKGEERRHGLYNETRLGGHRCARARETAEGLASGHEKEGSQAHPAFVAVGGSET